MSEQVQDVGIDRPRRPNGADDRRRPPSGRSRAAASAHPRPAGRRRCRLDSAPLVATHPATLSTLTASAGRFSAAGLVGGRPVSGSMPLSTGRRSRTDSWASAGRARYAGGQRRGRGRRGKCFRGGCSGRRGGRRNRHSGRCARFVRSRRRLACTQSGANQRSPRARLRLPGAAVEREPAALGCLLPVDTNPADLTRPT